MITLYGFGPSFNLADPSPFVAKVDLYLRIHNIEYKVIADSNSLQKAPKGKLPFIDDDGTVIADSYFIIQHLKEKHGADIDEWLNEKQRATAYLMKKSLEENLYWCIVHSRWIHEETWQKIKENFFGSMPFPLNKIVPIVARKTVRKNLNGHGLGRHSDEEILHIAEQSLQSLSILLGNKPYFFGEKISSLDVTAYVMISSFTQATLENPTNTMAKKFNNLVAYAERIKKEYYPELD